MKGVSEYSSFRMVERLAEVVKPVEAKLEQEDQGVDEDGKRMIVSRLTAEAELADGRIIRAKATTSTQLEKLLYERVRASLKEQPVAVEHMKRHEAEAAKKAKTTAVPAGV